MRFYGIEQEGRLAFILMDYIQGSTLRGEIFDAGAPLPVERILPILQPVCSALHYAHQQGIVHCDLKSANIMLDANGKVYLTDFGITRMSDAATATLVGVGTPAYMAQELVKGKDPSPQTDIYALGIVLYEVLTGGERPFTGEKASITGTTAEKVRWEQLNQKPVSPRAYNPTIPCALENLVLRCLAKDPKDRYLDMGALASALANAARGIPAWEPAAKEQPRPERVQPRVEVAPRFVRDRPVERKSIPNWLFALLGVLALLIIGLAIGIIRPHAAMEPKQSSLTAELPEITKQAEPIVDNNKSVDKICATDDWGCAIINPGQTIKIGMGSPMTGGDATFGLDSEQAGLIAVEDAGEFNGFIFELIAEDDGGTAEGGAAVANKFTADPTVVAVAGHLFSGASFAAMPIYEEAGIPMLSPSAANPFLTKQGSRVFKRIVFTDEQQGAAAAKFMYTKLGFRKVAFLHDGDDYGNGLAEFASKKFEALGGEVVELIGITPGKADYSPVLTAIATKNPDAIYFGGYTFDAGVIANQMKTTGLEDVIFFGCDGTFGMDFINRTGANGEGTYHALLRLPPVETPEKNVFDAAYLDRWGINPYELSPFTWNSYDCVSAITEVVKEIAIVGDDGSLNIPRTALVEGVRGLTNWSGISGTYTCFPDGDCNMVGPQFCIVQDGQFVAIN